MSLPTGLEIEVGVTEWTVAAAAMLTLPSVSMAKEAVRLAPLSAWNLRYEENSCQLVRAFGDKDRPTVMFLERVSPTSSLSLLVSGGGLVSRIGDRSAKATFLPFAANVYKDGSIGETVFRKHPAIYWTNVGFGLENDAKSLQEGEVRDLAKEALEAAREAEATKAITELEITERNARKVVLLTGPLGRAIAMMRECAKQQLVNWGVNPEIEAKIVRPAWPLKRLNQYLNSSHYPLEAVRKGEESIIKARLLIDKEGAVTRCTSLTAYKAPGFAEVVCERLKKVKFRPAELADGTKVPTYSTSTIKFVMQ